MDLTITVFVLCGTKRYSPSASDPSLQFSIKQGVFVKVISYFLDNWLTEMSDV